MSPACSGSRGLSSSLGWSFPWHPQDALELGIHFVVSSFVTGLGGDIRRTNQIKLCRTPGLYTGIAWPLQFTSLISLCSRFVFFPLWTPGEADLTVRSQFSTKSCPPRQLVASTVLSRWCSEDRPGCQKIFNPFFSPHLVDNLRLLLAGMLPDNHSSGMTCNGVHLKQIFSSHLWGCLGNTPMFPVRNSSCLPQIQLSGEQIGALSQNPAVPWEQAAARGRAKAPLQFPSAPKHPNGN